MYIGIDPDLRNINCAIVSDTGKLEAVFCRKNKDKENPLISSSYQACRLVEDVIAWVFGKNLTKDYIHVMIESQNMPSVKVRREKGQYVNYEDIRKLSVVTGQLMGTFHNLSDKITLIDPVQWKGTITKDRSHRRFYKTLEIVPCEDLKTCIYPGESVRKTLEDWSHDKPNPGDYLDINDSIGLALYGFKKNKRQ